MAKKVTGGNILSLQEVCKIYNYTEDEILALCAKGLPHVAQPKPGNVTVYLFTDSEVALHLTPKPVEAEIHDLPPAGPAPTLPPPLTVRPDRAPPMEEEPAEKPAEKKKSTGKKPAKSK